ncbi:SRPBCC family protein [Micromonospora sp. CPCC 206061]|uniref:SRPBCC family protein n=1 Tax=Micromonospora sp. CPCC 206061 TaxID=3122410 RepID=UPI002FF04D42
MTEIRISVQYQHQPELVWRALTDRKLLSRWFMLTDLEPHAGSTFELLPETLPGFDGTVRGELIEVTEGRRLSMRWRGEQMHSRVTWELSETPGGSRLLITQSGFLGIRGTARRRQLIATYRRLFGVRLAAVLDGLAAGADIAVPPPPSVTDAPEPPDRRRQVLVVLAAALLVACAAVVVANLPSRTSDPASAQMTSGSALPAATQATNRLASGTAAPPRRTPTTSPSPSGSVSSAATPAAPSTTPPAPEAAALGASYATLSTTLLGYRGSVEVANSGGSSSEPWTVTLVVQGLDLVSGVEGPAPKRSGDTVTFSGPALRSGSSTRIVFDVTLSLLGSKEPANCEIDGSTCAGL